MRIEGSAFDRAPRDHPLEYPGARPDCSFLFMGDSFDVLDEEPGSSRRLGSWSVVPDAGGREPLDERLLRFGAALTGERTPVLAYGSNAAPAQLAHKFRDVAPEQALIPVVRATVSGLDVVFAAKVASYGSVPATIMPSPAALVDVAVTFLDEAQLALLDDTERSYDRCRVADAEARLVLASGEQLAEFDTYVSTIGVLLVEGSPRRLEAVRARRRELRPATQVDAIAMMADAHTTRLVSVGRPSDGRRLRYADLG